MGMELQVSDLHSWLWDTNILNWWRAKINMMLRAQCTFGPTPLSTHIGMDLQRRFWVSSWSLAMGH